MKIIFLDEALDEYISWQFEDKKTLKRINTLIKDIQRNGLAEGIGKPERLKGVEGEVYSRRIDDFNRLVYSGDDDQILEIFSCKGHYDED